MTSPGTTIEAAPGFFIPEHFMLEATDIKARGHTDSVLKDLRLDPWELNEAWLSGYGQDRLPDGTPDPDAKTPTQYRTGCLARLLQLESTHKGGGEMLRRLNGIRGFGRATIEMLHHLCDERYRSAARAVLFATAVDCHNGGLENSYELYEKVRSKAPEDTAYILTEVGSIADFGLARGRLRDHGKDVRAHVIGIHAHGGRNGMNLGYIGNGRGGIVRRFETNDIGGFVALLADIAIPQTTHVLGSCSTGEGQGSFAEVLNTQSGMEVHAPIEPVSIESLTVEDVTGILKPEVKFRRRFDVGNTWQWEPSPTRLFWLHEKI